MRQHFFSVDVNAPLDLARHRLIPDEVYINLVILVC